MHSVICSGLGLLECFVIIKCTKFGQLILRKIIKIVATRFQILRLKMHQIRFRLWLRPRPRWGSLQHSPDPLAGFKGHRQRISTVGYRTIFRTINIEETFLPFTVITNKDYFQEKSSICEI